MAASNTQKMILVIGFSFIVALLLSIFPIPTWTIWFRPEWVLLVMIYWVVALPQRIGIGIAWCMGIFVDVLNGTILGEHALAFIIIAYLAMKSYRQFRLSPWWQQMISVCIFVGIYQLIIFVLQGITGHAPKTVLYWLPSITSMLLWPWIYVVLRNLRRRYQLT